MTSFDDAVRVYFDAPADATVSCDMTTYQLTSGCDTCGFGEDYDTSIELTASWSHPKRGHKTATFASLPELWEALADD